MKKFLLPVMALCLTAACTNTETSSTTETEDTVVAAPAATTENPTPPMDSAAKMQAWMAYATPGTPHEMLASAAGKWKTESTMWMEPGAPAQTSTGTADMKMVMGGRYQRMTYSGTMMGQPFEGEGLMAYDNSKKMFVNTWIDNMGTGIMQMEGPWDEATKTITLKGTMKDPITGKETSMREELKMVDATHQEMSMYCTQDGKENKNMEMKMTKM